jgi:hypothetical protein
MPPPDSVSHLVQEQPRMLFPNLYQKLQGTNEPSLRSVFSVLPTFFSKKSNVRYGISPAQSCLRFLSTCAK